MTDPTDGSPAAPGDLEPPARDHEHGTELRTFLIADVRGYTKYTAEFGDEAAGRLATRFAELVEEVVATRDGFLLELRGDEALVVFVSARQALRAAVELQERFLSAGLPRGVGIGLDAGEAVPVGDGFRGSALNLAARLCAQAGPGEIIASEAVIHLAARLDGISYVEPRSFRLKGLAEPIRAVGVVASSRVPHGIRRRVRRARQLGAERKVLGAAVVAGLAVVIGALALSGAFVAKPGPSAAASHDTTSSVAVASAQPATGPGVAFLDAASGDVKALNPTLRRPIDAQWVGGNLWVYDADPAAFHRIDPSSGSINRSISTTIAVGRWLVDGNAIWVTDHERPSLHRIDIQSGRETDVYPLSSDSTDTRSSGGIVKVAGSLWIALFGPATSSVVRVDPQSGSIVATVDDVFVIELAATDNRIWGSTPWGEMTPIDPETSTAGPAIGIPGPIQSVAVVGNDAWATNRENGAVYQVQPGRDIAIPHFGFPDATSIAWADGMLWVGGAQTATALDAGSGRTRSYPIGHAVSDVKAAAGTVAVLSAKGIEDALAGLSGSVLKIAAPGNPFPVIDPAIRRDEGSEERDQVDQATCARLLNYPDKPAPEGSELVPEIAESMPTVSPDGLTYTFQVRPGYAFSPPSSEPITADTFRATIERALDPRLGPNAEGIDLLGDIVGAPEFHARKSGTVSGLSVDGNALRVTLRAPSSSFLRRLALPTFCPVPIGTARVLGGVNDPPLPGSGPMYVADRVNGQYMILKRNPNYGGTRKPGFEAIAWLVGIDSADAISRLEAGTIDLVPSVDQLAPGGPIDRAWGPGSNAARAGDQRYFVSDGRVTAYLALKSERSPVERSRCPAGDRPRPRPECHGGRLRVPAHEWHALPPDDRQGSDRTIQARGRVGPGLPGCRARAHAWTDRRGGDQLPRRIAPSARG